MIDARQQRGLAIAALFKITQKGKVWIVPSQTGSGKYTVVPDKEQPHCTCPDHEAGFKCKHIFAVEFVIHGEFSFKQEAGVETVTETMTISATTECATYQQNWSAYNKVQVGEKAHVPTLAARVVQGDRRSQSRWQAWPSPH